MACLLQAAGAAVTEQLVRTLGPDDSPAQLVAAFLATAMARGGEAQFRDACHEVRKVAGGLWDVPRQRTALLAAVLDAELRTMTGEEAHIAIVIQDEAVQAATCALLYPNKVVAASVVRGCSSRKESRSWRAAATEPATAAGRAKSARRFSSRFDEE
eukprot:s1975_g3.t1